MAKARTLESLREEETIVIWNASDDPAELWTASPKVRKEWESFGYKPVVWGSGWRLECSKDRITLKTPRKA